MKILKYTNQNVEEIKNFIDKILKELFEKKVNHKQYMQDLDNIKENYLVLYLALDNKKIIGTVALKRINSNCVKLKRMYVNKNYRGRGLAQELYKKAEDFAIKNKFKTIKLSTTTQMKGAQKFYAKNGFKKTTKKGNSLYYIKQLTRSKK